MLAPNKSQQVTQIRKNPYVGPVPYNSKKSHLFFGRQRDADTILSLIITEGIVLFYALSGAGKSSLVNAKLIPELDSRNFEVLPVARVIGALPPEFATQSNAINIYTFNLLRHLARIENDLTSKVDLEPLLKKSLKTFLAERPRIKIERNNVLSLNSGISEGEEEEYKPRVIIIDQFEEILTTNVQHWKKREDFFLQIREAVEDDPTLSILFVMRADFISKLDRFANIVPGRLQARYGMERLRVEQAKEAVREPAIKHGRPFEEQVVEDIIEDLCQAHLAGLSDSYDGEVVEPVQLQVVCYQLWESLSWDKYHEKIVADDLKKIGDISQVIENFYDRIVKKVEEETGTPEKQIRLWFNEELITPTRIRDQVGSYGRKAGSLPLVTVTMLVNEHLVQAKEDRGGIWYELAHDRFIDPILNSNRKWFEKRDATPLYIAAKIWKDANYDESFLYRGKRLQLSRKWAREHADVVSQLEYNFLNEADEAELRRTNQRKLLTYGLYFGAALCLVVSILAITSYYKSTRNARRENALKLASEAYRNMDIDPERSLLLALHSVSATYTIDGKPEQEAQDALNLALQSSRIELTVPNVPDDDDNKDVSYDPINSISFNQDSGRLLATASANQGFIWDAISGSRLYVIDLFNLSDKSESRTYKQLRWISFIPMTDYIAAAVDNQVLVLEVKKAKKSKPHINILQEEAPVAPETKAANVEDSYEYVDVSRELAKQSKDIYAATFSPDGKLLATVDEDGRAKFWEFKTGQPVLEVLSEQATIQQGQPTKVKAITFSHDGQMLAIANDLRQWTLWDVKSQKQLAHISFPRKKVSYDPFSSEKDSDNDSQLDRTTVDSQPDLTTIAISPNNKYVAAANNDGAAMIWEIDITKESPLVSKALESSVPLKGHAGSVTSMSFSPDSKLLVTSGDDRTAKAWSVETRQELFTLNGHRNQLTAVAFSPDGRHIATGSTDGTAKIWRAYAGHQAWVEGIAFNKKSGRLATVSLDGTVVVWNVSAQEELLEFSNTSPKEENGSFPVPTAESVSPYTGISFDSDGRLLAVTSNGRTIVWNAELGQIISAFPHSRSYTAAFSKDGKYLVTAGAANISEQEKINNQRVIIWDVYSSESKYVLPGYKKDVYATTFSPDGKLLATVDEEGRAKVWDFETRNLILSVPSEEGDIKSGEAVKAVAFDPVGQLLATADGNGLITLWDVKSGKQLGEKFGFISNLVNVPVFNGDGSSLRDNPVNALAFNGDGSCLATAQYDGVAVIWDIKTRQKLSVWSGHKRSVRAVAFVPNQENEVTDQYLVTASSDNSIIIHHLDVEEMIASALARVTRRWSTDERRYLSDEEWAVDWETLPLLINANKAAAEGNLKAAEEQYGKLNRKNKSFYILPLNLARSIAINSHMERIRTLRLGGTKESILRFLKAEPASAFSLDPERSNLLLAGELVLMGEKLVRKNPLENEEELSIDDIQGALKAFKLAEEIDPDSVTVEHLNNLCWYGSLGGHPLEVLPSCYEAVNKDLGDIALLDTRGTALALLANEADDHREHVVNMLESMPGDEWTDKRKNWANDLKAGKNPFRDLAIDDFVQYTGWIKVPALKKQREQWAVELREGRNPFDDKELINKLSQ